MGNNKTPNFISFIRKGNLEHTMMEDTSMIFYLEKPFFVRIEYEKRKMNIQCPCFGAWKGIILNVYLIKLNI